MIEKKPILSEYLGLKRKIDKNTLASIDDVDSDLFKKYFKAVMDVGVAEIVIFGFPPAGPIGIDSTRVK